MDNKLSKIEVKVDGLHYISLVMTWGAVWGIIEATIGNALHLLPFRVPTGSLLFPIGYYCMQKSFKESQDIKSILYTSSIASSIKLINIFSPLTPAVKIFNPAACVLLEGLAVYTVFRKYEYKSSNIGFKQSLIMSLSWRIGYYLLCMTVFIPLMMMETSSIMQINKFVEFFIINGLINSIIIYSYGKISKGLKKVSRFKYNFPLAASFLLLAILITWTL